MRIAINIACFKDKAILLVKKKQVWILPGGKPEEGENEIDCILRETGEELPGAMFTIGEKYDDFVGQTPHQGDQLTAKVYLGSVQGEITPAAEISDARFVNREDVLQMNLSDITRKIVISFIADGNLL